MNSNEKLDKNFISAVVYINTADSAQSFENFIERLDAWLAGTFVKYEVIFVDDDSKDDYMEIIRNYKKEHDNVMMTILHMGVAKAGPLV